MLLKLVKGFDSLPNFPLVRSVAPVDDSGSALSDEEAPGADRPCFVLRGPVAVEAAGQNAPDQLARLGSEWVERAGSAASSSDASQINSQAACFMSTSAAMAAFSTASV